MIPTERLLLLMACISTMFFVMSLAITTGEAECDPEPEEDLQLWYQAATPAASAETRQRLEALNCTLSRVNESPDVTFSCDDPEDNIGAPRVIDAELRRVQP